MPCTVIGVDVNPFREFLNTTFSELLDIDGAALFIKLKNVAVQNLLVQDTISWCGLTVLFAGIII